MHHQNQGDGWATGAGTGKGNLVRNWRCAVCLVLSMRGGICLIKCIDMKCASWLFRFSHYRIPVLKSILRQFTSMSKVKSDWCKSSCTGNKEENLAKAIAKNEEVFGRWRTDCMPCSGNCLRRRLSWCGRLKILNWQNRIPGPSTEALQNWLVSWRGNHCFVVGKENTGNIS